LFALMPPRPSATGSVQGPATSQPRVLAPGLRRTMSFFNGFLRITLSRSGPNQKTM
jgi:hypothetical protein